jgi:hypothetical protein
MRFARLHVSTTFQPDWKRAVRTAVAFATVTAIATLALAWPATTNADGNVPLVQYTANGTKLNDILVKGLVQRDSNAKTGWVVVVTATNNANHPETIPLETDVSETTSSPMARVPATPRNVWSTTETVTLSAGQTMTKRYELPADVAAKVAAAAKPANVAPKALQPITSVFVAFEQKLSSARPQGVRTQTGMSSARPAGVRTQTGMSSVRAAKS